MKEINGVKGVRELFPNEEKIGIASISHFSFDEKEDIMFNLRAIRDGGGLFRMYDGDYVRLTVNGQLTMSDTGMERKSNKEFIKKANGDILIGGLGIGLIINAIKDSPNIKSITVIEKYQDVISLVAPKFNSLKNMEIICADIFEWEPPKGKKYDTIYFDIWTPISIDNLDEIKKLHNKFKNKLNRKNESAWMNSWMKEYLQELKRKESRYSYY